MSTAYHYRHHFQLVVLPCGTTGGGKCGSDDPGHVDVAVPSGIPNGSPQGLVPQNNGSAIEVHGPYQGGYGFPSVSQNSPVQVRVRGTWTQ